MDWLLLIIIIIMLVATIIFALLLVYEFGLFGTTTNPGTELANSKSSEVTDDTFEIGGKQYSINYHNVIGEKSWSVYSPFKTIDKMHNNMSKISTILDGNICLKLDSNKKETISKIEITSQQGTNIENLRRARIKHYGSQFKSIKKYN